MTLPVGTWNINANGTQGTLSIAALGAADGSGNQFFKGSVTFGGVANSASGYWDETHQEIYFLLQETAQPNYGVFQVYRGNLFSFVQFIGIEQKTTWTLAGDLRIFSMSASTAAWNGLLPGHPNLWCAQLTTTRIVVIPLEPAEASA